MYNIKWYKNCWISELCNNKKCAKYAVCVNGQCQCRDGFHGNPMTSCTRKYCFNRTYNLCLLLFRTYFLSYYNPHNKVDDGIIFLTHLFFSILCHPTRSQFFVWFSLVTSTNKTDRHDITEILLKVALNTITLDPNPIVCHPN